MTPSEILRNLDDRRSPNYDTAWIELQQLLTRMASGKLVAGRAHICSIPEQEREDVVADVLTQVLAKSPLAVAEAGDAPSRGYLRRMLGNRWISIVRKREREELAYEAPAGGDDEKPRRLDREPNHALDELIDEKKRAALLETLFEESLRHKSARYHDATRAHWVDLKFLVYEGGSMDALLDEMVGEHADQAARVKARNRVFTQSKRLRIGLADAVDALLARGKLSREDAGFAEESLLLLMRCQRPDPAHVKKSVMEDKMGAGNARTQRSETNVSTRS